jgi:hypothetical protein
VPYTLLAVTFGISVPSLQLETVNVKLVPDAPLIEKTHPVAVPAFEKSASATEFTFCEKVREYEMAELVFDLVGSVVVKVVGIGELS